ncbi:MAG: S1 family peptidase [Minisyncoccota bacterium]
MPRLSPYLGLILALIVGVIAVIVSNEISVVPSAPFSPRSASSTISVASSSLPVVLPEQPSSAATTSPKAVTPEKKTESPTKPAVPSPAAAPTVQSPVPTVTVTPVPSSGNASLDASAAALRSALVNIMCYAPAGSPIHSISGSGVFIDSKGIILTNAHVAQYFLLADQGVDCTIRSGSPAISEYKAALIYISPAWIHANATVLTQATPNGTGEYDFALLAVTSSATSGALPSPFPYLSLAQTPPSAGTPVAIASFAAQFLDAQQIRSALYPTVVFGSIKNVFTFGTNTVDVLALGGSAAAQEGSSGGGIADASGSLIGTITTSTITGATDTRSLGAITASYIRSEYAREMGSSIDALLSESTAYAVADFAPKMPALESILTAQLP